MNNDLLKYAYSLDDFEKNALDFIKMITTNLKDHRSKKTVEYQSPEDELNFWQKEFSSTNQANLIAILENARKTSMNFHSNGYLGHQVAILPPITILTSAFITYLNNPIVVYEVGMAGISMEKIVIDHLIENSDTKKVQLESLFNSSCYCTNDHQEYQKQNIIVSQLWFQKRHTTV